MTHKWKHTYIDRVGSSELHRKFSQKTCTDCGATFIHYYGLVENLYTAIKIAQIDPVCKKEAGSGKAVPMQEQANETLRLIAIEYSSKKGSRVCIRSFSENCYCYMCHPLVEQTEENATKAREIFRNWHKAENIQQFGASVCVEPPTNVLCASCQEEIQEQAYSCGHEGSKDCDSFCFKCVEILEVGSLCPKCDAPIEWWAANKKVARRPFVLPSFLTSNES